MRWPECAEESGQAMHSKNGADGGSGMENGETKNLSKYLYVIAAVIIAISAWYVWNFIYSDVGPLPDPQVAINAAKDEVSDYKTAVRTHGEAAKEGSVNIYVQTAKDAAVMAPDAIADGVVSELRIFAAELAGSGTNSLSSD